jgi:hypothetical protein
VAAQIWAQIGEIGELIGEPIHWISSMDMYEFTDPMDVYEFTNPMDVYEFILCGTVSTHHSRLLHTSPAQDDLDKTRGREKPRIHNGRGAAKLQPRLHTCTHV